MFQQIISCTVFSSITIGMATMQELQRLLLSFNSHLHTVDKLLILNFRTKCGHLALSKLPWQAEENHHVTLWLGPSQSPMWVQFSPCRLLVSIPYAIGRESASCQLSNRGVHLCNCTIYWPLQQSLPAEAMAIVQGHQKGTLLSAPLWRL